MTYIDPAASTNNISAGWSAARRQFFKSHAALIALQCLIFLAMWRAAVYFSEWASTITYFAIGLTALLVIPYFFIYSKRLRSLGLHQMWFFAAALGYFLSLFVTVPLMSELVYILIKPEYFQPGNQNDFMIFIATLPPVIGLHAGAIISLVIFHYLPEKTAR